MLPEKCSVVRHVGLVVADFICWVYEFQGQLSEFYPYAFSGLQRANRIG
ncbi:hypothetical protein C8N36_102406 [Pelagimonas varians]|uniref:Uncharacterized protein n=1 Tax=Pelagimonas varians TaxID=696760 RepID=A0A238K159_9RHOB|nr:hypothetical protein C8N36_102406 [Pelagimonas varians]SMX36615.1 hypothetical protein PEV8663_00867 [Pelagimonas varians]